MIEQQSSTPAESPQTCAICGNTYRFTWTDTHGIAACIECGLPYRLYHYDAENKRIAKPPEIAVREEWVPVGKRYWEETHQRTFPAAFDFLRDRGGRSYSGATAEDCEAFNAWLDAHPELIPPKPDAKVEAAAALLQRTREAVYL